LEQHKAFRQAQEILKRLL